jgi:hypothetical protein
VFGRNSENGIEVVQPLARDTVPEIRRIADCFIVLEQLFQCRLLGQIPIAGVHTDDAIRHVSPLTQRIVSDNNRIRSIVLTAEELSLGN